MSTIVSWNDYRSRRGLPARPPATLDAVAASQECLAAAMHELGDVLGTAARSLDGAAATLEQALEIGPALAELARSRADWAEIEQLTETGDIDGCVRLRDAIARRAALEVDGTEAPPR